MPIDFQCTCGRKIKAPDGSGGRRARCPNCSAIVIVPEAAPPADAYDFQAPAAQPVSRPVPPARMSPVTPSRRAPTISYLSKNPAAIHNSSALQRYLYLVLAFALLPLVIYTFHTHVSLEDQLDRTVDSHMDNPDLVAHIVKIVEKNGTIADILEVLPEHRLNGALLAHDSEGHWLFALASAAAFFALLMAMFPSARRQAGKLLLAGCFTGTVGILLLLGFQYVAAATAGVWIRGGGVAMLVMLIVKFIGFSYSVADDPGSPIWLAFIGFTCGVGLCEEITKAIPLLLRVKTAKGGAHPSWHSLMVWGLASGIGFGIAEGIMYSNRHYNGVEGMEMYLVRFISCVVLHAVWSGAVGVTMYNSQGSLEGAENNWIYFGTVVLIVIVPMTLHGLYDTLLTKEHDAWALVVAFASFGWLAFQIERMRRREPEAMVAG